MIKKEGVCEQHFYDMIVPDKIIISSYFSKF